MNRYPSKPLCEKCERHDKKYGVVIRPLLEEKRKEKVFWDTESVYHVHCTTVHEAYKCSRGHKFTCKVKRPCPAGETCLWNS